MDTIFMNSEHSRNQILVFTIHGKTSKAHTITKNLNYPPQHGVMNLNCRMNHIQY